MPITVSYYLHLGPTKWPFVNFQEITLGMFIRFTKEMKKETKKLFSSIILINLQCEKKNCLWRYIKIC